MPSSASGVCPFFSYRACKSELVIGRYVFVLAMGLLSLIISLIAQPLVLKVLGETVGVFDIVTAAIAGVFLFALYTVFQIPGSVSYTHLSIVRLEKPLISSVFISASNPVGNVRIPAALFFK